MSKAFTTFLTSEGKTILRDYRHASRLYVDNNYKLAPKTGFIYFVGININPEAITNQTWESKDVGLLAKKVDLPKFKISTETLNQYNRKTVVQTKLNYDPVTIEFHDDNSNVTNNLWINYFRYYYKDTSYGGGSSSKSVRDERVSQFSDSKFSLDDNLYGRYEFNQQLRPFLSSIDIFVLYRKQFTQITLINPKITEWSHDNLNQAEGAKIMQNRMSLSYETVFYSSGRIEENQPEGWRPVYYDRENSPYSVYGESNKNFDTITQPSQYSTITAEGDKNFDKLRASRQYGKIGGQSASQIEYLLKLLAKNYVNSKGLDRVRGPGYNIASSALSAVTSSGAGKFSDPPNTNQPGIINLPGGVGINIFKGLNTSVDGKIRANPAAIIFPKGGGG